MTNIPKSNHMELSYNTGEQIAPVSSWMTSYGLRPTGLIIFAAICKFKCYGKSYLGGWSWMNKHYGIPKKTYCANILHLEKLGLIKRGERRHMQGNIPISVSGEIVKKHFKLAKEGNKEAYLEVIAKDSAKFKLTDSVIYPEDIKEELREEENPRVSKKGTVKESEGNKRVQLGDINGTLRVSEKGTPITNVLKLSNNTNSENGIFETLQVLDLFKKKVTDLKKLEGRDFVAIFQKIQRVCKEDNGNDFFTKYGRQGIIAEVVFRENEGKGNLFKARLLLEWLAYRKDIGKQYKSQNGINLIYREILGWTNEEAREAMDFSIKNQYMGLFPPKKHKGKERTTGIKNLNSSDENKELVVKRVNIAKRK